MMTPLLISFNVGWVSASVTHNTAVGKDADPFSAYGGGSGMGVSGKLGSYSCGEVG